MQRAEEKFQPDHVISDGRQDGRNKRSKTSWESSILFLLLCFSLTRFFFLSLCLLFVFELPSKLRVIQIRKKIKSFIFSKMAPTIFIKFDAFIVHSNPNNMVLSAFPGKIFVTRIIFLNFFLSSNVAPKVNEQSCSNSIFRVVLQLSPASPFHFRPSLEAILCSTVPRRVTI